MEKYRFEFIAGNGTISVCHIVAHPTLSLIVATFEGIGNSVTKECRLIAQEAVKRHSMNPHRLLFIEHYPKWYLETDEDRYRLITFTYASGQFNDPKWTELAPERTQNMLRLLYSYANHE